MVELCVLGWEEEGPLYIQCADPDRGWGIKVVIVPETGFPSLVWVFPTSI